VNSTIAAPVNWVEAVGNLRFPSKADHRLQELMERNNQGLLQNAEKDELETLVQLSEQLSLVRAEALQILGRQPSKADASGKIEEGWEEAKAGQLRTPEQVRQSLAARKETWKQAHSS
jgi:hypothetical protein